VAKAAIKTATIEQQALIDMVASHVTHKRAAAKPVFEKS